MCKVFSLRSTGLETSLTSSLSYITRKIPLHLVVFVLILFASGSSMAASDLFPADYGWDAGVSRTATSFEFQFASTQDVCEYHFQAGKWEENGYAYLDYESVDGITARCTVIYLYTGKKAVIGYAYYRYYCPWGSRRVYSDQRNRDNRIYYGTGEYVPGYPNPGHAYVYLEDDPGLQCYYPRTDISSPADAKSTCSETEVGNPINCATGVKTQTETDYRGSGADPLLFQRTYVSHDRREGGITGKWKTIDDLKLDVLPEIPGAYPPQLRITFSNGNRIHFTEAQGRWNADKAHKGYIIQEGLDWVYITNAGVRYYFDPEGFLQAREQRNGLRTSYTRYADGPAAGKIHTISNPFGKTLQLQYDDQGRLSVMIDPANQTYQYSYDDQGRLTHVTYPDDTPSDDTDNPVRAYLYENDIYLRALTGIIDENGDRYATWAYANNAAILSEHADSAERVQLNYIDKNTTEVTFVTGQDKQYKQTYHHQIINGAEKLTQVERQTCDSCAVETQEWKYDSNGYVSQFKDWGGGITIYTHDGLGRELSRTEAAGTPEARTITTGWNMDYRLPVRVTETGKITERTYDAQGRLLSSSEYDY